MAEKAERVLLFVRARRARYFGSCSGPLLDACEPLFLISMLFTPPDKTLRRQEFHDWQLRSIQTNFC